MKPSFRFSQRNNISGRLASIHEPMSRAQSKITQMIKQRGATMIGDNTFKYERNFKMIDELQQDKLLNTSKSMTASSLQPAINNLDEGDFNTRFVDAPLTRDSLTDKRPQDDLNLTQRQRNQLLFIVLISLFTIETLMMNIETIMPTYVEEYHPTLTEIHSSTILVATEIAAVIFSPIVGIVLEKMGRKNAITVGYIIIVLSNIGSGFTSYITDDTIFFWISILARFIQGIGDILVQTACYSLLTFIFTENREKYLGYGEGAAGFGLMIGPVIGGILNTYFSYMVTFICFAGFCLTCGILSYFLLASSLNKKLNFDGDKPQNEGVAAYSKDIPYKWYFFNRRSMFSLMSCMVGCFMFYFSSGFITVALKNEKGIPTEYHGYILAVPAVFYMISTLCYSLIGDRIPRRIFMLVSFILMTISIFLLGPSTLLGIPDKFWIFIVGYGLLGGSQGLLFIPIIPEIIDAVYLKNNIKEGEDEYIDGIISDKAAGLYGSFLSFGLIAAPIIGSMVYYMIGNFNQTCDQFAIVTLVFTVIFLLFNVLIDIWYDRKEQKKLNEDLSQVVQIKVYERKSIIELDEDGSDETSSKASLVKSPQPDRIRLL